MGLDSPCEGAIIRGKDMLEHARRHSDVSYAKMAEPIDLPFGLWTRVGRRKHKFSRIHQVAPMCPHGRAHWCHLANTIKPSVCGGDAALCQITLTTCLHFVHFGPVNRHVPKQREGGLNPLLSIPSTCEMTIRMLQGIRRIVIEQRNISSV